MSYKKYTIIFIILIGLTFSLSFLLTSKNVMQETQLAISRVSSYASRKTETNFTSAVIKLINGNDEIVIRTTESNVCYWINPTMGSGGYYIDLKKYNSSETKGCYGKVLEKSMIPTGNPINIIGMTNCLCKNKIVIKRLNEKKGTFLKIT